MAITAIYSMSHFAVDLGCAYAAFSGSTAGAFGFLLYNFFAFAMQMPLGLLADRFGKNRWFAVIGTLLVALICCFPSFGITGIVVLGLGNALFHIGGGLDVLNLSGSRAAPLGVFVSPGAFGLFVGMLWGNQLQSRFPVLLLLILCAALMILAPGKERLPQNVTLDFPKPSLLPWAALLFLVVVLRSYGGMQASFPWKTGLWNWLAVAAVVLGKTCGGFLSDRFGSIRISIGSLVTAAALFCISQIPICGILALFLFNMTMPITLHALAQAMPGCKGFSFGLLTFALFLGYLPAYFGAPAIGCLAMAAVCLISLFLLLPALHHTRAPSQGAAE